MKVKYVSEIVLQRRKKLGVSQGMVCEGLCTAMTLSRFESGRQSPSWDCTAAILQRLGLPDDQICAHLTREEMRLVQLRKEVLAYCGRFAKTVDEEREQVRIHALDRLRDLERCIKKKDRINHQFILMTQAILGPCSLQNRLEMLMEAICLTSPHFDLDKIGSSLYCANEIVIISQIAVTYSRCGECGKAIDIYGQLLKLVLKRTPDHNYLPLIAYNYARCLGTANRLNESLEISELGQKACIKQEHYHLLPKFLHLKGTCYHLMGENDRSTRLYQSAYHLYGATSNIRNQEALKAAAEEHLNLIF